MTSYAGFDTYGYPGMAVMSWLRGHSNLCWIGFYLKSPSHPDASFMTRRAELVAMGWGFAPIYVGQQVVGPGVHAVTAAQGKIDGADAAAKMGQCGFPPGSHCYLDLENGPPDTASEDAYVGAWIDALIAGDYGPGVYCSYQLASRIAALRPNAGVRLWVFHVPSTAAHVFDGPNFPTPALASSGYAAAYIWQRDDEARIGVSNDGKVPRLGVDLNVAASPDPSAPAAAVLARPSPQPSPTKETTMTTVVPATATVVPVPVKTTAAPADGLVAAIEALRQSADTRAVALASTALPWYVRFVVTDNVIKSGIDYGFAMIEGAAKNIVPSVATVQKLVTEAVHYIDTYEPSFLAGVTGPIEDLIITKLQSIGYLPASFSRASMAKAA